MPDGASFGGVLDVAPSAIEVECPNERFAPRGTDEPRGLQHSSHSVWRVTKAPNLLACQPQPEVPQGKHCPHVPPVPRIGEGQHLPGPRCRYPEQCLGIRVAADDAVECHHVVCCYPDAKALLGVAAARTR